ncbi:MAG: PEP-CTERM sorting domain-containing protein [Chthonomonas sp.]|nr:PEP-CTERM sorting domain-containing protein [Chthonomonas sp.]
MKKWTVIFALAAAASANASFDLMLLPSGDGRVSRIDPINRASLGSFGPSTPSQVFSSSGGIWVQNSTNRYARYDYSTGELLLQSSVLPGFTSNAIAGNSSTFLLGLVGSSIREFNMSTGASATIGTTSSTVVYSQIERMPNGILVLMGKVTATNKFVCSTYSSSGVLIDSLQTTENVFDAVGQMAITGSGFNYRASAFYGTGGGSPTPRLTTMNITATGLVTGFTGITVPSTTWSANAEPATVAGHDGLWVVGRSVAGTTQISQIALNPTPSVVDTYSINHNLPDSGRWSMVNIVAPEPSSLWALGLAAFACIRRRRS